MSEKSLLPTFVRSLSLAKLLPEFREAVVAVLREIGVQEVALQAERLHLADIAIGPTSSRSVLGSMNDFRVLGRSFVERHGGNDLVALALNLAEAPCGPLKYGSPKDVARALLDARGGVVTSAGISVAGSEGRRRFYQLAALYVIGDVAWHTFLVDGPRSFVQFALGQIALPVIFIAECAFVAFGVLLLRQVWSRAAAFEISRPIALGLGGSVLLVAGFNALLAIVIPMLVGRF